jgi:hypothetical protein
MNFIILHINLHYNNDTRDKMGRAWSFSEQVEL